MKHYWIHSIPEEYGQMPLKSEFHPKQILEPWNRLEEAAVEEYPWDNTGYRPLCYARVGWNSKGLHVLMYAKEKTIRTEVHRFGGRVCDDSCMEFFVKCCPEMSANYINLELTDYPAMYISYGSSRYQRIDFTESPPGIVPQASKHCGSWWAVSYTVPMEFISQLYGRSLKSGDKMKGNFYICGEMTERSHFGMWQKFDPALVPHPDFHQPTLFGDMTLD